MLQTKCLIYSSPKGAKQEMIGLDASGHRGDEIHFRDVKETKRVRLRGRNRPQEFMPTS